MKCKLLFLVLFSSLNLKAQLNIVYDSISGVARIGSKSFDGYIPLIDSLSGREMYTFFEGGVQSSYIYFENGKVVLEKQYDLPRDIGLPSGRSKLYYKNGNIEESYFFKKGVHHGVAENYYESGILKEFSYYNEGELVGPRYFYHHNGRTKMAMNYSQGKLMEVTFVTDTTGAIISKGTLTNGTGFLYDYTNYNGTGAVRTETYYRNGLKDGLEITYCAFPDTMHAINYEAGKKNGKAVYYSCRTKKITNDCFFKNDELNGLAKYYDDFGIVVKEILYKDGKEQNVKLLRE